MAYFYFHCPSCDKRLKTTDRTILGKRIRCPRCGKPCPVPLRQDERLEEIVSETPAAGKQIPADREEAPKPSGDDLVLADEMLAEATSPVEPLQDLSATEEISPPEGAAKSAAAAEDVSDLAATTAEDIVAVDQAAEVAEIPAGRGKKGKAATPDEATPKPSKKPALKPKKGKKKGGGMIAGIIAGFLVICYVGALGVVAAGVVSMGRAPQPPMNVVDDQRPPEEPPDGGPNDKQGDGKKADDSKGKDPKVENGKGPKPQPDGKKTEPDVLPAKPNPGGTDAKKEPTGEPKEAVRRYGVSPVVRHAAFTAPPAPNGARREPLSIGRIVVLSNSITGPPALS